MYKFGEKASGWRTANPNFANPPENPGLQEPPPPPQPQPPQHHHHQYAEQLHADTKPKTTQEDMVLSPQHLHLHHYTTTHMRTPDIKPTLTAQDLVSSPPAPPPAHQFKDKFLSSRAQDSKSYIFADDFPSSHTQDPNSFHFKDEFLSSPHALDTKAHHHHPLSLTMHHTPHQHHT